MGEYWRMKSYVLIAVRLICTYFLIDKFSKRTSSKVDLENDTCAWAVQAYQRCLICMGDLSMKIFLICCALPFNDVGSCLLSLSIYRIFFCRSLSSRIVWVKKIKNSFQVLSSGAACMLTVQYATQSVGNVGWKQELRL